MQKSVFIGVYPWFTLGNGDPSQSVFAGLGNGKTIGTRFL